MPKKFSNRLIRESSPYLLQHAHNPVNWYPWGEEALAAAKEQDKPILVSIGYAACHWCHVMERESFENEAVAGYMNEHFINIKIDREERPDLDHIYMDAVQAIAGNGGWPLNVFLTTDARPFFGGTYFPPQKAFNRPSWMDVLNNIHQAWINKREELITQANNLVDHISLSAGFIKKGQLQDGQQDIEFNKVQCDLIFENIMKAADTNDGGFGAAPKFPQTFTIQYLLAYGHFYNNPKALQHAEFSLQQMLKGGIYDHLAGGLSRYSTDGKWLAPHFEKMLYDNALLIIALADAYQLTGNKVYADAIHKTLGFFIDEMRDAQGGFFAALDADSEGEEGRFYVWDKVEIEKILDSAAALYCDWYGVSEKGNWEGKNILHTRADAGTFAQQHGLSLTEFENMIQAGNRQLLTERNKRPRPQTDDKLILGWNALFLEALCRASAALNDDRYKNIAISLYEFIMEKYASAGMINFHTYKNGEAKHPAFLDDYAYLVQACISLQEITSNQAYLHKARELTAYVIENFEDRDSGFFYYTHVNQQDVITRKLEFYDGAVPSGNSIMAENLFYLATVFEDNDWRSKAHKLVQSMVEVVAKYPTSFAVWASLVLKQAAGMNEITITGKTLEQPRADLLRLFIPNKVFQSATTEENLPLLKGKKYVEQPLIYLCRDYACLEPVKTVKDLKMLLKNITH